MAGDTTPYTNLITSEHGDKPKFMAMVAALTQPLADLIALYASSISEYDIDQAVGAQLDVIGKWVGVSRQITTPLQNSVYFAFDAPGLGFDQGVWLGPNDPVSGITALPDYHYRLLLYARILNNRWDGDPADAYALANIVFAPLGHQLMIVDHGNLTMGLGLIGSGPPDALTWALLINGYLNIKPAGIHISEYYSQTAPGPMFAFDMNTPNFAGFDTGAWATILLQ